MQQTDTPRVIVKTKSVEEAWIPIGEPQLCECGHEHWARELHLDRRKQHLAPQWGFCEDTKCKCRALRRAGYVTD